MALAPLMIIMRSIMYQSSEVEDIITHCSKVDDSYHLTPENSDEEQETSLGVINSEVSLNNPSSHHNSLNLRPLSINSDTFTAQTMNRELNNSILSKSRPRNASIISLLANQAMLLSENDLE